MEGVLSEREVEVLERVATKFKDFGSVEISNYSHNEKGYISTQKGEIIPYEFVKGIQL